MRKRTFDKEDKIQAVEGCLEGDKFLAQVAKVLQHASSLGQRIQRKQWKEFCWFWQHKPQNQEIIEFRRRNQELEEELAILKKR